MITQIGLSGLKPQEVHYRQNSAESGMMSATELTKSFADWLDDSIKQLNEQKMTVEHLQNQFITGELSDPHTLMIAAERAALGLELTVQVRNKVIEAYHEIMRIQL
jgi:flagellar hook-basal body complex protein FliE